MKRQKPMRLLLIGRSEAGKTTLTQALRGAAVAYQKTQAVSMDDLLIDTPGEYIQDRHLGAALAIYSYEADMLALVLAADEPFSLFSPCITSMTPKEVIGIITKIDHKNANIQRSESWLRLAGCQKIFYVNSLANTGIDELKAYLGWTQHSNKIKEKK